LKSLFRNSALNRINLHYAIQTLAQGAGGLFILVFLLKAGVSVPVALAFEAAIVALRFAIRPWILPLVLGIGLRRTLILGTLAMGLQYALLPLVKGLDAAMAAVCVSAAIGNVLYWTTYHAYFARLGASAERGGQIGLREAIVAIVGIVAPLLGGGALVMLGSWPAFIMVTLIQLSAALPLLGGPEVPVVRTTAWRMKQARQAIVLVAGDGWMAAGYHFAWQAALFTTLGQSFSAYGGAMALAALVGAVLGLLLGRSIDQGFGRRSVIFAYGIMAGVILLRSLSLDLPWLAVFANAAGALAVALVSPTLMTPVYNMSTATPCSVRFHIATEGGWDTGQFFGCLLAAGLVWLGAPLSVAILLALPGAAILAGLLWRQYGRASPA
jgi:hypothetical protein